MFDISHPQMDGREQNPNRESAECSRGMYNHLEYPEHRLHLCIANSQLKAQIQTLTTRNQKSGIQMDEVKAQLAAQTAASNAKDGARGAEMDAFMARTAELDAEGEANDKARLEMFVASIHIAISVRYSQFTYGMSVEEAAKVDADDDFLGEDEVSSDEE